MAEIKKVYKNGTAYDVLNSDTVGSALTAGTGIGINSNTISNTGVTSVNNQTGAVTVNDTKVASSAPTATEGTLWYDSANDKLKAYNGSSWDEIGGGITKVFTLSSDSDLTTAQAVYDWYVNGGNPIVIYNYHYHIVTYAYSTAIVLSYFRSFGAVSATSSGNNWCQAQSIQINVSSGTVTSITRKFNRINLRTAAPASGDNSTITLVI